MSLHWTAEPTFCFSCALLLCSLLHQPCQVVCIIARNSRLRQACLQLMLRLVPQSGEKQHREIHRWQLGG